MVIIYVRLITTHKNSLCSYNVKDLPLFKIIAFEDDPFKKKCSIR